MNELLEKYDAWLDDHGPAALVIREHLMPVEGHDGVLFPATFAASEDKTFKGGYNVDTFADGKNICLIDSVGSQANRIEPLFARHPYAGLVPQVVITAGTKKVNLLDAGHRAGDAIVRREVTPSRWQRSRLPQSYLAPGTLATRKPNCRVWLLQRFAHSTFANSQDRLNLFLPQST